MTRFLDQIHLHKCQGIVTPQWFGIHLYVCLKILQINIFRVYLGFVQPQIVLSRLQAMHHGKELFFISWP